MDHTFSVEILGEDGRELVHEDLCHLHGPHHQPVVLGLEHRGQVAGYTDVLQQLKQDTGATKGRIAKVRDTALKA